MPPNVAPNSPFFAPATPRKLVTVQTPGGTSKRVKKDPPSSNKEKSTTISGATSNLVNAVIGAGIVGMPYAIKETGLVAGAFLIVLCAVMTEKSLRILIGTAKHVGVATYERLFESTYGSFGFYFVSINMIVMAYGGCLTYLMIIRDTLPVLLGVSPGDLGMERAILTVSTMAIILPISMQRDMAALAKTSKLAVLSQCFMVLTVVVFSPWRSSINENGGLIHIVSNSVVNGSTVFIGLGVLGFAFVCQHSAFLNAGSLERPTKKRWAKVTSRALLLCGILEAACGIMGYLAFLDDTEGDVLNNFLDLPSQTMRRAGNAGRALICATMFFVYPMDSFVLRHVFVVFFFRGRRAREGDDALVLSRKDRRVATTLVIYLACLIPALYTKNVGSVLAISGTIGASSLAYIGPGLIYMAVYGEEFLALVNETWGASSPTTVDNEMKPLESSSLLSNKSPSSEPTSKSESMLENFSKDVAWYILLMPIWCAIADRGQKRLKFFRQKEALKSPHISRIASTPLLNIDDDGIQRQRSSSLDGVVEEERPDSLELWNCNNTVNRNRSTSFDGVDEGEHGIQPKSGSQPKPCPKPLPHGVFPKLLPYGAISGGNQAIGAAIAAKKQSEAKNQSEVVVPADVENPTCFDFCIAIFFIAFGMLALSAGLVSILLK